MKLNVIGCAGSFPGPSSPASCYLVEHDGARILLDLGNGALGALQTYVDIYSIDAVVLSHMHPDHCADVCSFYVARRYRPGGALPPIPLYGPIGVANRCAQMYGLDLDPGMHDEFDFFEYGQYGLTFEIAGMSLTATRVDHSVPSYALRVEAGGCALVYSGDTGPCDQLVAAGQGADLALFEASFLERNANPTNLHLTGKQAAQAAIEAGVPRLVLTHLVAWNDSGEVLAEARQAFSGEVQLASPGLTIEI